MNFLKAILLVLTAGLIIAGRPGQPDLKSKSSSIRNFGFEYFPLDTTRTLVYDSTFGETVSNVVRKKNELIVINESEDFSYIQNFIVGDDGIYITQTQQKLDVFMFISSEASIRYNEPALRLPIPLGEGSEWNWEGDEYKDDDSSAVSISGQFIGTERITTHAGVFECINIELHVNSKKGSKSIVNEWLAPGIGLVKLEAEIDGNGIVGLLQSVLGYDEIYFELKEII